MPSTATPVDFSSLEHRTLKVDGLNLHAVMAGPPDGPPVILLHGFPEFWYGWRYQIGALAAAGFRVVAPDQRGYSLSEKPGRIADYALDRLAADVAGIADACGHRAVSLVGHDWGGIVAWWAAMRHPERIARLAILNAPHLAAAQSYIRTHPIQMLRSWYVLFFQLPGVPEALLQARDFRMLRDSLTGTSRPGTFTPADLERYREAWSEPGALTAMIHWYRALLRFRPPIPQARTAAPTLIIWGERDRFLETGLARDSLKRCERGESLMFPTATHWVQHEEAAAVNEALIRFLAARPALRTESRATGRRRPGSPTP